MGYHSCFLLPSYYNSIKPACQAHFRKTAGQKCRFVNDVLHIREGGKDLERRAPGKGSHREVIVLPLSSGKLGFKVVKGKERVGCVEFLIVFPVAALNLSIVSWRIRFNQFMLDPKFGKSLLEESLFWFAGAEPVCKL